MNLQIDLLNRECRMTHHDSCLGTWEGLGVEVSCNCPCHTHNDKVVIVEKSENNLFAFNSDYDKHQNNFLQLNKDNRLTKQNKKNASVDKSFEGSSQQMQLLGEESP